MAGARPVVAAGLLGAAVAPALLFAVGSYAVGGVANGIEVLASRSVLHDRTPAELHGRVFAAYFGLIYAALVYVIGPISGGHVNPAVTLGAFLGKRLTAVELGGYWAAQLAAATPNGIDVDFENVGGDIMDAIFARLNVGARVALCGLISGYNSADPPPGPRAFGNLLIQRATLQGFVVLDHFGRAPEAIREIAGLITEGRLTPL